MQIPSFPSQGDSLRLCNKLQHCWHLPGAFDSKQIKATMPHGGTATSFWAMSVWYMWIMSLEEQWCRKKSLLLEPSEFSYYAAQESRQSYKHIRHLWQEPAASWPDLTASEQIPPSSVAQKQLPNHGGSPREATPCKGEEWLRRGGKQRKKFWLRIYLGQSVFSTATEDCVPGPGRQSVGICHSWVNPRAAGKSKQHCKAAEL